MVTTKTYNDTLDSVHGGRKTTHCKGVKEGGLTTDLKNNVFNKYNNKKNIEDNCMLSLWLP